MTGALHMRDGAVTLRDAGREFRLRIDRLDIGAGRAVALTGDSGSGKTLVLELLGLLRAPDAGTRYDWRDGGGDGRDLAALWASGPRGGALARMRGGLFGFVPQTGGLMPFLDVAENIALPQKVTGRADARWVDELIRRLGLGDVARQMPGALSIGQRQRTAIARALSHRPPFVIADEPTAALDPESADAVLELLLEVAAERDCGVILSSHDRDRIARFGLATMALRVTAGEGGQVVSTLEAGGC